MNINLAECTCFPTNNMLNYFQQKCPPILSKTNPDVQINTS